MTHRRCLPVAVLLACGALVLLLPGGARGAPADQGRDTKLSGAGGVSLVGASRADRRGKLAARGRVTRIARAPGYLGTAGWHVVALRGAAGATARFQLLVGDAAILPFRVGDELAAEIDCSGGGWHVVCDGAIRDAQGALLIGVRASGAERLAPDWDKTLGPVASTQDEGQRGGVRSGRREHRLVLRHRGRTVLTRPGRWRLLRADDGEWLVSGSGVRRFGLRPPEGVDYDSWSVMRLRRRDRPTR